MFTLPRTLPIAACVLALSMSSGLVAHAQAPRDQPRRPAADPANEELSAEIREAMQRFFRNRLRAELALTDSQMEQLMPMVDRLEQQRGEMRRERMQTVRQLQRGLREGAGDEELRELLRQLDGIEDTARERQRSSLAEIDQLLTARQSVQFRFFTERFQREIQRRIRQLREGDPGRRGRSWPSDDGP